MRENVTVITGGSGGIGKSVVKTFLKGNDKVIVLDVNEIKDEDILSNKNFSYIKTDVTEPIQIENAKKEIQKKYNYIDNIVSMAGINMKSEIGGMETITIEDIDKSIKLNLNSHIYLVKILLDLLSDNDNPNKTITMISSINAITDYGLPAYSAAKSGMYGFVKSIARTMGNLGIRVNTISLGTVPHHSDIIENNEYFESKLEKLAKKEFIKPEDVADTIYYLTYTMKGIIGQDIVLDRGQSIWMLSKLLEK